MNQIAQPANIFSELWFMVPRLPFAPRADLLGMKANLDELEEMLGIRKMEMVGSVAVIPVDGILASGVAPIDRLFGFTGYEQIAQDIHSAIASESVNSIVLSINSPGGQATGMLETAAMVIEADAAKPVVAHTSTLAASSAYGIASGARKLYSTPSAIVGAIGTYMVVYDVSKMFEEAGIHTNLFASGKFKGAGVMGTSLTDDQKVQFMSVVGELAAQFKGMVHSRRKDMPSEAMEGQSVVAGYTGMDMKFVDEMMTLDTAIEMAEQMKTEQTKQR